MLDFVAEKGTNVSNKDIEDYVDKIVNSGRVVPGNKLFLFFFFI